MTITLDSKIGLIAGNGQLPVIWAKNAKLNGIEVVTISLSADNKKTKKKHSAKVYDFGPGQIQKISDTLQDEGIKQLAFIGKVHKGLVLRRPKFDARAIELLKQAKRLNDDAVMLMAVSELEKIGVTVIDQTIFIKELMVPTGVLGSVKPTKEQEDDAKYGFWVAKAMGQVDIGQTVVIKNKMVMAVEAIEGTDKCIERGAKIAKKGAVVVKTAKPSQDLRFDVPAFGLATLKTMKKYKASVIAVEANNTIIVDKAKVIEYANAHNIVVMAI